MAACFPRQTCERNVTHTLVAHSSPILDLFSVLKVPSESYIDVIILPGAKSGRVSP